MSLIFPRSAGLPILLSSLALVVGCGTDAADDDDTLTPEPTATEAATPTAVPATPTAAPTPTSARCVAPANDCDETVCPSEDDQEALQQALIDAEDGDTVCMSDGIFYFYNEISLDVPNVTLKGAGPDSTILDFTDQIQGGNGIHITADGCTVENFQVLDSPGDGIKASAVEGITYRDVSVFWTADAAADNGAYGLYPVSSSQVLIERCKVKGASDAGVYVGQSFDIIVQGNEAWGNVAGTEIENSTNAEVMDNHSHDNTGGVLVFNLPDLPVGDGKRAKVHDNIIENNNTPNFAPEGNIVSIVPQGTGLLILATDENEFHDNIIRDNMSAGIAIFSYDETLIGEGWEDPSFDPYPERNYVHDNVFENNGYAPKDIALVLFAALNAVSEETIRPPLPSILWDGCVNANFLGDPIEAEEPPVFLNCMSGNGDSLGSGGEIEGEATYANFAMCGEVPFEDYSFDIEPVTCTYTGLAPQSW